MVKPQRAARRTPNKSLKRTAAETATETKGTETEEARRTKHYVQPAVLEHIRGGKGEPVTLKELRGLTGAPDGSIQNAALRLMKQLPQIEVVVKGNAWRWSNRVTDLSRPEDDRAFKAEPIDRLIEAIPAQRPAPAVETKVPIQAAGERYLQVGTDRDGKTIVRKDGGDLTLYVLIPL